MEPVHEFLHPRIRVRVDVDMGGIIGLEIGQGTVDEDLVPLHPVGKGLLDEVPHPVPDHRPKFIPRMLREPPQPQRMVDGLAQILQRIQQRPVQVEEYNFVGHGAKIRNFGERAFVPDGIYRAGTRVERMKVADL